MSKSKDQAVLYPAENFQTTSTWLRIADTRNKLNKSTAAAANFQAFGRRRTARTIDHTADATESNMEATTMIRIGETRIHPFQYPSTTIELNTYPTIAHERRPL